MAQYAQLNEAHTAVIKITDIDPSVVTQWISSSNPKLASYRPVNMISQPGFDPATQSVTQNGWTITANDVQPIWVINTLDAATQSSIAAQAAWNTLLSTNVISQCDNFLAIGTPTNAQNAAAIQLIVKFIRAFAKSQLGITN